tara:strand:+ start:653 stop:835 length:183 start_codon:yes stop_codon:yes gene_type:complete
VKVVPNIELEAVGPTSNFGAAYCNVISAKQQLNEIEQIPLMKTLQDMREILPDDDLQDEL